MPISKSSFKLFLNCPAYFWFNLHRPNALKPTTLTDFELMLADQGKLVEKEFYKLYPETKFIKAKGASSIEETKASIDAGATHIAQAAFMATDFFAQSDLVQIKGRKAEGQKGEMQIDIYEIKSSSSMQNAGLEDTAQAPSKEEHIIDLAFQYEVATQAGHIVDKTYLVELNKAYTLGGELDRNALFSINDVTKEVTTLAPVLRQQMQNALVQANITEQPVTCECKYLHRKKQCPTFSYMHPELTSYNVYDLAIGRSPKRLRDFVDASIFRIEDIPPGTKMTDSFRDQVITWNENREIILADKINRILDELVYPLYFLDYETTAPGIPLFEGTRPYQQIPFQYSLHIIDSKDSETRHTEYLHCDPTSPMSAITQQLSQDIGDNGTIIVWNKTFEKKCNENLAEYVPTMRNFLLDVNNRIFDLMDIFSQHLYVHKDFKGSYSIKKVLPVLVPELSYGNLLINDGGKATTQWGRMVFEDINEDEKLNIQKQLLDYCKLDTLAMVEIYKVVVRKLES